MKTLTFFGYTPVPNGLLSTALLPGKKLLLPLLTLFILTGTVNSFAQLSITATGTNFAQNFNGMGTSATATVPGGFKAGTNSNHASNGTATAQASSAPASNATGACYNFGNPQNATDRCVGFLNSGGYGTPTHITLQVTNNTGAAISSFTISWNYEKYRSGTRQWDWTFFHGTASTPATAAATGNQTYAADAANTTTYNPPQSTAKSVTVSGLNIANGASYYFRWTLTGNGGSSNGQGLGIDDFTISATPAACSAPTTAASGVSFPSMTSNSVNINWTNGNGGGRVLMMNTVNSFGIPTNGSNPTANTTYAGSGSQVIYNGSGSGPVTVTGLTPGVTYYFRVYEFCTPDRNYLGTGAAGTVVIPSITTGSTPGGTPFTLADCAATDAGTISYTKAGTFNAGNVFTAELSDASGSFAAPLSIGTVSSITNGSININIPAGTASGAGYRVRVLSSNPVVTGTESSNFTITQNGVCASLASHYFRSVQDGNWNQTSTWESSPDQITWIAATLTPNGTSSGILIQSGDSVFITNTGITMDQTTVEAGAILQLTNTGGLMVTNGPGDDLVIDGLYIHSYSGTATISFIGTVRIHSGGIIRTTVGTTAVTTQYAGNNSGNFFYETGAIYEYRSGSIFTTTGQTYFPNAAAAEIPIFRITLSSALGANGALPAVFNGILEQTDGVNITWSGTGSKTFRNGIRLGAGSTMTQTTSAPFLITGNTAVFDGPGTLVLNASGLSSTAAQISNGSDITVNTTGANASFGGIWVGGGHSITGTAEMLFTGGADITGETSFQRFGTEGNATIASGAGNMQTVTEYAALRSGTLTTNGNITFISNASGTAYLNDFTVGYTGTVSGNIHMQRYNPLGLAGFRQLGTPVQMANISSLSGFTPSGTAGFIIPVPTCNPNYVASNSPYGNWMQLVENGSVQYGCGQSLFQVLTSGGMTSARGYYMDVTGNSTLTFTGAPTTGIVTFGLTHANTAVTDGWNMVSNPYPSPLQWELSNVPVGVDAIGKIWVTSGAYTGTWQDLDPNAVGTQAAAIGQAFQVRVSVPGTSVPFLVDNLDRTTSAPTYLFAGGDPMTLNIDILGNGFADLTKVRFMDGATTALDAQFDSPKMLGNSNQPMVYSVWNGQPYSTNTYGTLTEVYALPLGIKLAQTGEHTFVFSNMDQFAASTLIYLEDTENQVWQDIRSNDTYTFTQPAGANETRFVLHFYPPVQHNMAQATCETYGQITLTNTAPITWNYALSNAQGQPVGQGTLEDTQTIPSLPIGTYTLTLTEPGSGYMAVETVTVEGVQPVTVLVAASSVNVETGQEIQFTGNAQQATGYVWDFGDQNTSTEQNPIHSYNAAGSYHVTFTASNEACEATGAIGITVGTHSASLPDAFAEAGVRLWNDGSIVYLAFETAWEGPTTFTLYDLQGRSVYQTRWANAQGTQTLNCGTLGAGTYTAELRYNNHVLSRKMLMGIR